VGDSLITGHGAGKAPRLPGPVPTLTMAGGPEHPSLLGPSPAGVRRTMHRVGFKAMPSVGFKASQSSLDLLLLARRSQALEGVCLTGAWGVSGPSTALCHLGTAPA